MSTTERDKADTPTRLSVNINDETASQLRRMAEENGITVTEAVRRSVAVYEFFDNARKSGKKVELVDKNDNSWTVQFLI